MGVHFLPRSIDAINICTMITRYKEELFHIYVIILSQLEAWCVLSVDSCHGPSTAVTIWLYSFKKHNNSAKQYRWDHFQGDFMNYRELESWLYWSNWVLTSNWNVDGEWRLSQAVSFWSVGWRQRLTVHSYRHLIKMTITIIGIHIVVYVWYVLVIVCRCEWTLNQQMDLIWGCSV